LTIIALKSSIPSTILYSGHGAYWSGDCNSASATLRWSVRRYNGYRTQIQHYKYITLDTIQQM